MTVRWIAGAVASAVTLWSASAAAQIVVAVEQAPGSNGSATECAAQLNNDTFFDFTATIVPATGLDSAAELAAYDVVLFGDSGFNDNDHSVAMGNALATAAQNTGLGVVSVGWFLYSTFAQDATDQSMDPVVPVDGTMGAVDYCSATVTLNFQGNHPVTAGLGATLTLATSLYVEHSAFAPDAVGGTVLGTSSAGSCSSVTRNSVAVGTLGMGRLVYLGPLYLANVGQYNNGDLRSGNADRLFEQAVSWAAGGGIVPTCMTNAQCDDNNVCTGTELCINGLCSPGMPLVCSDNNVCTDDICNALNGCQFPANNAVCNDNDVCTTNDVCGGGVCNGVPLACNDNNTCTDDTCAPPNGCVFTPNSGACDDGDQCTVNDTCVNGMCSSSPADCDDMNDCTTDTCAPMTGCSNTANTNACNDANACTENDVCGTGMCAGAPIANCCVDDGDCGPGEICHPVDHVCIPGGAGGGPGAGGGGPGSGGSGGSSSGGNGSGNDDDDKSSRVDSGCGCRTVSHSNDAAWLVALGLAAFGIRRRRAQR